MQHMPSPIIYVYLYLMLFFLTVSVIVKRVLVTASPALFCLYRKCYLRFFLNNTFFFLGCALPLCLDGIWVSHHPFYRRKYFVSSRVLLPSKKQVIIWKMCSMYIMALWHCWEAEAEYEWFPPCQWLLAHASPESAGITSECYESIHLQCFVLRCSVFYIQWLAMKFSWISARDRSFPCPIWKCQSLNLVSACWEWIWIHGNARDWTWVLHACHRTSLIPNEGRRKQQGSCPK